ncbi:MAG: Cys-tRNA(Pro) deacylase [Glaciecola sp.]|jgi:Cys-tRNA(Pro)/Cys-tRNA(Cys) deacylase|nr:Cys-tRNA(Pro) deacylase [Glaciecola sp.]MDG1816080.1 Cys-tRNA(Pro) deacylase [Glaciecola sp.]MDG2098292.1 Cys-tRNA(Pro) deacylase [Glaciecola sp.]
MTPAINAAKRAKVNFSTLSYEHDPHASSYGLEAATKLNLDPQSVYKTLVTDCDGQLVVAIIPVTEKLSLKQVAKAVKAKKSCMADPTLVAKKTGYIMGGVSPLGQKSRLMTLIASQAESLALMHVSAGKRGLEIGLAPKSLQQLTKAKFVDICA